MDTTSKFKKWKPRKASKEDYLLYDYCRKNPGLYFTEVPVGNPGNYPWASPTNPRKIDAVKIIDTNLRDTGVFESGKNIKNLQQVFSSKKVQLIEAKQQLNRSVIGQLLVAKELFQKQYKPIEVWLITIVNEIISEGALLWVCKNRFKIKVINQNIVSGDGS